MSQLESKNEFFLLFTAFVVALVATAGSLFFSEVMQFPPCSMCWYQRICMYPLVLIFSPALVRYTPSVIRFSLPLAILGWCIALYHNLLHWGIVPESASPCLQGVPCSTVYLNWLGFITIPLMSLLAFSIIIILLFLLRMKRDQT